MKTEHWSLAVDGVWEETDLSTGGRAYWVEHPDLSRATAAGLLDAALRLRAVATGAAANQRILDLHVAQWEDGAVFCIVATWAGQWPGLAHVEPGTVPMYGDLVEAAVVQCLAGLERAAALLGRP